MRLRENHLIIIMYINKNSKKILEGGRRIQMSHMLSCMLNKSFFYTFNKLYLICFSFKILLLFVWNLPIQFSHKVMLWTILPTCNHCSHYCNYKTIQVIIFHYNIWFIKTNKFINYLLWFLANESCGQEDTSQFWNCCVPCGFAKIYFLTCEYLFFYFLSKIELIQHLKKKGRKIRIGSMIQMIAYL